MLKAFGPMVRALATTFALAATLLPAAPAMAATPTTRLLITTDAGVALEGALDAVDGVSSAHRIAERVHLVTVHGAAASAVAQLRALPHVVAVEASDTMTPLETPDDPQYAEQWAHAATTIEDAWEETTGTRSVGVALLDTGVRGDHPDLAENLTKQVDATGDGVVDRTLGTNTDTCGLGHGTATAGVIGADGDNARDVAGAAWGVALLDVAVVGQASDCRMTDASLVTGLGWAAGRADVHVINIGFGRQAAACPTAVQAAIDEAVADGKVVIAAAGNVRHHSTAVATIPAACEGVISVGATTQAGAVADYSTTGAWVDLVAPGGDDDAGVLTLSDRLGTTSVSGTSFSAAYVSGVAALLFSEERDATPDAIERALLGTADDLAPAGRDDAAGWGLVDPAAALDALTTGPLPAATESTSLPVADHGPARIAGSGSAISQSVTVSAAVFRPDDARHAVLARADDYADALAGSSLAAGWGPILLASSNGALPDSVKAELARALPSGGTVYLLGGTAALPSTTEAELAAMGLRPERLAGTTREETASAVASEVVARRAELGAPASTAAIVTTARNWPDAAVASSLAAALGAPILVTAPNALHTSAADALTALRPTTLYIVGGTAAVSAETAEAARRAAGTAAAATIRLAGLDRAETATQVAAETEAVLRLRTGAGPSVVLAVNVRRGDGFGFILSATPVAGVLGGVFLPVEGEDGSSFGDAVSSYACGIGGRPVAIGGTDLVSQAAADRLTAIVADTDPACA